MKRGWGMMLMMIILMVRSSLRYLYTTIIKQQFCHCLAAFLGTTGIFEGLFKGFFLTKQSFIDRFLNQLRRPQEEVINRLNPQTWQLCWHNKASFAETPFSEEKHLCTVCFKEAGLR